MRTVQFVLLLALEIGLTLGVQRWDKKRLTSEQRARSWNAASWGAAIYAFGALSMLGWGWVTRKSRRGLDGGLLCAAALLVVLAGLDSLSLMAFGLRVSVPWLQLIAAGICTTLAALDQLFGIVIGLIYRFVTKHRRHKPL